MIFFEFYKGQEDRLTAINEVYFGKTKEILEMESILNELRTKWMSSKSPIKKYDPRINGDPLLEKFNKKMGNFFGFRIYSLNVVPGVEHAAYTAPFDYSIDVIDARKQLVADEKTFKYNKKAGYCLMTYISQGLLLSKDFTTPEIMAVLLHEIGHNFSSAIDRPLMIFKHLHQLYLLQNLILHYIDTKPENWLDLLETMSPVKFKSQIMEINNYIKKKFPFVALLFSIKPAIEAALLDVLSNLEDLYALLSFTPANIPISAANIVVGVIQSIGKLWTLPFGYKDEKIADAFATAYGYGPELSSALYKMTYNQGGNIIYKAFSRIPVIGPLHNVLSMPLYILASNLIDPHPDIIERHRSDLRMLKKELNDYNIDPAVRKVIEKDIAELEKEEKEFLDLSHAVKDPILGNKLFWAFSLKLSDGDIRHFLFDFNFDKHMDDTYKEINS